MAMAANVTIAQVSEVVALGELDPENVVTPGIFVQHVVPVQSIPQALHHKEIEMSYHKLTRDQIARRVAQDIPEGSYVNLGIGLPTKIADYLPADKDVFLHSENGLRLLVHHRPGEEDPELINAGKEYVTMLEGGCFFHHGDSFAMMRGGHLDICVLGAFQIATNGDLANWHTGAPDAIPSVGGAMDLAVGAKKSL